MSADSGVRLKEDQSKEKSKDNLSWACYRKKCQPMSFEFGEENSRQAEELESFKGGKARKGSFSLMKR